MVDGFDFIGFPLVDIPESYRIKVHHLCTALSIYVFVFFFYIKQPYSVILFLAKCSLFQQTAAFSYRSAGMLYCFLIIRDGLEI